MTKSRYAFLLILLFGNVQLLPAGVPNSLPVSAVNTAQSIPKPFFFTENKGQWDARVLYKCQAKNGMTWFLERDGITLLVSKEDRTKAALVDPMEHDLPEMLRRHPARYPMKAHALKFHFVKGEGSKVNGERVTNNADSFDRSFSTQHPTPSTLHRVEAQSVEANGELPWHNNYFLGNDSSKWAPNCRNYSSVVYREVWDGIDIEWYENEGKLEFDFVVHPGFDPNQIRMSCEGLEDDLSLRGSEAPKQSQMESDRHVTTDAQSRIVRSSRRQEATDKSVCHTGTELQLQTSLGELRTALPSVYQISANGTRNEIDAQFELTDEKTFGIILPNGHDTENTLRIDPLIYSTFLGGTETDVAYGLIGDGNGGAIVTGKTASATFPTTSGAIDTIYNGGGSVGDCFVTHLDSTGSQLLYSTYLGGSNWDQANAITSDDFGGTILTGYTLSADFPITIGAVLAGTIDCFVARLNSSGSSIVYSRYWGGTGDDEATAITTDGNGGCFLTGFTTSSNFPTTTGAYDQLYNGGDDCFVTHFSQNGAVAFFSTYLGGSNNEIAYCIVLDNANNLVISGWTNSTDFPTTSSSYDTTFNGGSADCFVTNLNGLGVQLLYSTFLGASATDIVYGVTKAATNGMLLTGITNSDSFPVTENALDTSSNGGGDCFITNIDSSGSQLVFSSYLGGENLDGGLGIAQVRNDRIVVAGLTSSINFPITTGAIQSVFQGGSDCFLAQLNQNGTELLYGTYLGGSTNDQGCGIVGDSNGGVILCGSGGTGFPTTPNAYDTTYDGGADVIVTRIRFDTTDVATRHEKLPLSFTLKQNYPNPFNSSTTISYRIPKSSDVDLRLFDITGREVITLVNQKQPTGSYRVTFDGKNLSSGTYFVRMQAGEFVKTQKMVLLR